MASSGMIYEYIPSFMTTGSGIQVILRLLTQQFERHRCWYYWWEGFMKCSVEMASGGVTHLKWNQLVNPATSSPADDVHHYVIPPKLLLTNRFYFQQTSVILAPVGRRKGGSLSGRSPAPITDNIHVATIATKHSVLNLREINRNNTHTALASVLTYYGWVSLIF
jgi:hypothetical protein